MKGMTVGRIAEEQSAHIAAWLLRGLGAEVLEVSRSKGPFTLGRGTVASLRDCRRADLLIADAANADVGPAAILRGSVVPCPEGGLPPGTVPYTCGVALAIGALAAWRSQRSIEVSELGVAIQVYLPEVMAVSYGAPSWPAPPQPIKAPGGGWLSADLGAPGDKETFSTLLDTLEPDARSYKVSVTAQEWRLPVCEYLPRQAAAPAHPVQWTPDPSLKDDQADLPLEPRSSPSVPPLGDVAVCDLTAMWAGPLATWLLTRLGAVVHKIEPASRLDGFRAIGGGGIYPGGVQTNPGEDSGLWNALNYWKDRAPLDLRDPYQREQFVALANWCDVVVDSFSPRVMPNFGLNQRLVSAPGRPVFASMPAFPPGPRRDWVAYGTGVHALLGLGQRPDGTFYAPIVTYPDVVAGFTGALAIVAALVGRDRGRPTERVEVPLYSAAQPLLAFPPGTGDIDEGQDRPGEVLFDAGMASGAFTSLPVAGTSLMHPRGPFQPF